MDALIRKAIAGKTLIQFRYQGHLRICEPHVYGCKDGQDGVLTYQIRGSSKSGNLPDWRRVYRQEVDGMISLAEFFAGARPFHARHSSWDHIYAIVA